MWTFGVAAVFCLIGGSAGFSDLFLWTIASLIFSAMSWRGIKEKEKHDMEARERYQADVQAAARATSQNPGPPPPTSR
jgi:hypothetical protein